MEGEGRGGVCVCVCVCLMDQTVPAQDVNFHVLVLYRIAPNFQGTKFSRISHAETFGRNIFRRPRILIATPISRDRSG